MAEQKKKRNSQPSKSEKKPFLIEFEDIPNLTPYQIKELVQDLRIHQVELEAQVQELSNTQEDLHGSMDKYQELYNSLPMGYLSISKDYSILEANDRAAKMLGASKFLLQKSKFTKFIAPTQQSQDTFYLFIRRGIKSGQQEECELEMRRSDGSHFPAQIIAMPVDNSTDQFHLAIQYITERKQAEQALRDSEERYRGIVETAEEGIAIHDSVGTIAYVNERMANMLGYSREERIGKSRLEFV